MKFAPGAIFREGDKVPVTPVQGPSLQTSFINSEISCML